MINGGRRQHLRVGDAPGVSESRPPSLDESKTRGRIDTSPDTYAFIEETSILPNGRLGKIDVTCQIRTDHQRRSGDESRIAVLPVAETQYRQVRPGQVHVVGVLANDLGAGKSTAARASKR